MVDKTRASRSASVRSGLLERARRLAPNAAAGSALTDLATGLSVVEIAERRGLPPATLIGIESFYDQLRHEPQICDGTSCHFAGGRKLADALGLPTGTVRCLGHCYAAPSFRSGDRVFAKPSDRTLEAWIEAWGESGDPTEDVRAIPCSSLAPRPVVFRNLLAGAFPAGLSDYDLPDGEAILAAVEAARLRGRGGALYPTAAKWKVARDTAAERRWVVANGDEGDPGSFVDRLLLEQDPHAILAGMLACARAIAARRGIVYIRAEYPRAQRIVRDAIAQARAAGKLGPEFDVEVVSGAGSYVCGEETALLRSIQGLRGEPWIKPPYPAVAGLHGEPTVVQNVETLAVIPWVARNRAVTETKAVSLAGALRRPGAVEVPLGMPLRRVLELGGGGPPDGRTWSMALIGGPMGRVLPAHRFDTPLSYEALPGLGHAGIVVLDQSVRPRDLAEHLFAFARAESCGSCTPCRVGTARLAGIRERETLERLLTTMEIGSLCGFGQSVPRPIRDLIEHYGDEVLP
ncbi:MAG TPA: NADH-ubiquinone oxidoreductase-F iron-sulfur binding region domain-containing protein [Candidatus Eisenbacteria bacterium]|nr:NADH-ubiquinone oxidoreductase-F iron-sulfur binding region domain-containing protein [Candidatus Eisenbacteria bacterium]